MVNVMAEANSSLLADALVRVTKAGPKGVVRSADISRSDRERLRRAGFLMDIVKGWNLLVRPGVHAGESTAWYTTFWNFLATYLAERFGNDYCLSAAASLELHIGTTTIPRQIVAITAHGGKTLLNLPHDTSVLVYQDAKAIPSDVEVFECLRVMALPTALCRLPPAYYRSNPIHAELALRSLKDIGPLIRAVLEERSATLAGRFAGAFAFLGDAAKARDVMSAAASVGMTVKAANPFDRTEPALGVTTRAVSPYAGRIKAMFREMRDPVLKIFDGVQVSEVKSVVRCIKEIESVYVHDAYHSLSIEGYHVSEELIRRIRDGKWKPNGNPRDQADRDAMAAKGYHEAFTLVEKSVRRVLNGGDAARTAQEHYQDWYRALFSETVKAGLLEAHRLAGHRNGPVYIRNSKHVPPRWTAVSDSMEALFDCLSNESEPIARAVLGHMLFGFIHPYFDGNGRLARFLMNLFLVTAGYPWTIVRVERRNQYMSALEEASTRLQIHAFARFIREEMQIDWQGK